MVPVSNAKVNRKLIKILKNIFQNTLRRNKEIFKYNHITIERDNKKHFLQNSKTHGLIVFSYQSQ